MLEILERCQALLGFLGILLLLPLVERGQHRLMADHGEAHGEDGRFGHRIAHPSVTTVPYADFILD